MARERIHGFNADARRRISKVVREVEQSRPPGVRPGAGDGDRQLDRDCIWIKNSTGYDLRRGDAVRVNGGPSLTATIDHDIRYFTSANAMSANYAKPWGIATEIIKSDGYGQVQMSGLATCYATIADSVERPYLAPIGTGGILKPSWWGPAEIVYADIGTSGEKLVLARLGNLQTPIYKATTKAAISPGGLGGGSGNVGLIYNGSERETVTAYLNWMEGVTTLDSGTECIIRWFPDEAKWVIIEAEC
jgi:hypothetical protein